MVSFHIFEAFTSAGEGTNVAAINDHSNVYSPDSTTRYGEAYARAVIRTVGHSHDALLLYLLVVREQDPTLTCCRRVKGQFTCAELTCDMCHVESINLAHSTKHQSLGGVGVLFALKCKLVDRHQILGHEHGRIRPSQVDWRSMADDSFGKCDFLVSESFSTPSEALPTGVTPYSPWSF